MGAKQQNRKNTVMVTLIIGVNIAVILGFFFYLKNNSNNVLLKYPRYSDKIKPVNYKNENNWLSIPKKPDKNVDVFYVYPTIWAAEQGEFPFTDINDIRMRHNAYYNLKTQASVFEPVGNIYAPFYRQADALFLLEQGNLERVFEYSGGVPLTDIMAAFERYIKNYNDGRPFILAGHSQGAIMVMGILLKYMQNHPEIYKRMIATYAIGIPVLRQIYDKYKFLKPATSADDTGVIISYNTQSSVVSENFFSNKDAVLINPISWVTTEEYAPASQSIGANISQPDGSSIRVDNLSDARINLSKGVIISSLNRETYSIDNLDLRKFFPLGVFHTKDIELYYFDIQKNAKNRVNKYFEKMKNES